MPDPNLAELRLIKRLRTGGASFARIAAETGVSPPTAKKRWQEAIRLMQAGQLNADLDAASNADTWYRSPAA